MYYFSYIHIYTHVCVCMCVFRTSQSLKVREDWIVVQGWECHYLLDVYSENYAPNEYYHSTIFILISQLEKLSGKQSNNSLRL